MKILRILANGDFEIYGKPAGNNRDLAMYLAGKLQYAYGGSFDPHELLAVYWTPPQALNIDAKVMAYFALWLQAKLPARAIRFAEDHALIGDQRETDPAKILAAMGDWMNYTLQYPIQQQADVRDFMLAMGQGAPDRPTLDGYPFELRVRLILEEALEFADACGIRVYQRDRSHLAIDSFDFERRENQHTVDGAHNWPAMIDALIDITYVTYGAAVAMGIDLQPFWEAVHKANMAKSTGPVRADGKRLKPADWKAPEISDTLAAVLEARK